MSDTGLEGDLVSALHSLTLAAAEADRAAAEAAGAEARAAEARAAATRAATMVEALALALGPAANVLADDECLAFNGHILVPTSTIAGNLSLRLLYSVGTLSVERRLHQRLAERSRPEVGVEAEVEVEVEVEVVSA